MCHLIFGQIPHSCHLLGACFVVECSFVQTAYRVFAHKTALVVVDLFLCQWRHGVSFYRWNQVELYGAFEALLFVENHHHGIFTTHTHFLDTEGITGRCPHHEVAKTAGNISITVFVALLVAYGVEFGIVIYLEIYACRHRFALGVYGANHCLGCWCIVFGNIYFGEAVALAHHVFGAFVVTEHLGVHHHASRSGSIKPTEVKHRFGLACTEELPFTVNPHFHPCVIVVGVSPTRSVNLASGDAHSTHGCHAECRLFATASEGCLYRCQWRTCA